MAGYLYSPLELLTPPTQRTDMQDRIKELADEAHNATDHAMEDDPSLMDPDAWSDRMYLLFAQAIARECAEISQNERVVYSDDEWRVRCDVAEAIRARYGIKE